MRFRLTYQGELKSSQKEPGPGKPDKISEHKHVIRKEFHRQMKQLWQTNRFLREHRVYPGELPSISPAAQAQAAARGGGGEDNRVPLSEAIALNHMEHGYRFVPLVRDEFSLLCSLNILFLRRDKSLSVVQAGDLDNRIKTLIDALRKPRSAMELRGSEAPSDGEDPFFCLLEDDDLVTALAVESDNLLDPPTGNQDYDARYVKLIITVELKPYEANMFNLSLA